MEIMDIATNVLLNVPISIGLIITIYKMQIKRLEEKEASILEKISDNEKDLNKMKESTDKKQNSILKELYDNKVKFEKDMAESIREERKFWQELMNKNELALQNIFDKLNEYTNMQGRLEERLKSVEKLLQDRRETA